MRSILDGKEADVRLTRLAWTRGPGCFELASLLSEADPVAIDGDPRRTCISEQIDCLVSRKLTSFDLVPMIVPTEVDITRVESVTAAVGDGPHSPLAVAVAERLGARLGLPASVATAYHTTEGRTQAEERLARLAAPFQDTVELQAVEAQRAAELVDALPDTTLLVMGAPGGSWFYRQIYGPGHRLAVAAPNGVIVVRSEPRRCFHAAVSPTPYAIGVHLSVADARRVVSAAVAPVTEEGQLVGIVRRSELTSAPDSTSIESLMEPAVAVSAAEPVANAADLSVFLDNGPIPVVDDEGNLIGVLVG